MNWSSKLSECWVAECLTTTRETKQRQRGREAESTETSEVRDEMWGEVRAYVLAFVWNWAELGFRNKSNGAFYTFFFFFFLEFWPELAISVDSGPSRSHVVSRQRESTKSTWNPHGTTWRDTRAAGSPAHHHVPLVPRPCFIRDDWAYWFVHPKIWS